MTVQHTRFGDWENHFSRSFEMGNYGHAARPQEMGVDLRWQATSPQFPLETGSHFMRARYTDIASVYVDQDGS